VRAGIGEMTDPNTDGRKLTTGQGAAREAGNYDDSAYNSVGSCGFRTVLRGLQSVVEFMFYERPLHV
jgi:hypothetical protein